MATLDAMRIIAGEFRGREMLPPESDATRPVTDRVKQSIFDILTPWLDGATVYDCFAGTGSMGLESLSRGSRFVTFFEADRSALKRLGDNIQTFGLQERSKVIGGDIFKWANAAPAPAQRANLIFLDPPYKFLTEQSDALKQLARQLAQNHLSPEGVVIFRHDAQDQLALPGLGQVDVREYGGMSVEFLSVPTS